MDYLFGSWSKKASNIENGSSNTPDSYYSLINILERNFSSISLIAATVCALYMTNKLSDDIKAMFPNGNEDVKAATISLAKKLENPSLEITLELDSYEAKIVSDVLGVNELDVTFDNIGGIY